MVLARGIGAGFGLDCGCKGEESYSYTGKKTTKDARRKEGPVRAKGRLGNTQTASALSLWSIKSSQVYIYKYKDPPLVPVRVI